MVTAIVGQTGPAAGRKAVVVSSSWKTRATNHRLRITAKPTQIAAAQAGSGYDAHWGRDEMRLRVWQVRRSRGV